MIVKANLSGFDKLILALDPKLNKKVINRTINDLMVQGSNAGKRKVTKHYNLKSKQLDRYVKTRKSTTGDLEATFFIKARSVSLFNFINKSSISSSIGAKRRKSRRPVKVKVVKANGTSALRHAFVMIGKNGNIGIFERVVGKKSSTGKDKIKRLNTAGPSSMFYKEGIPEMQEYVDDNSARLFKKNFDFYVGK